LNSKIVPAELLPLMAKYTPDYHLIDLSNVPLWPGLPGLNVCPAEVSMDRIRIGYSAGYLDIYI